MTNSTPPTVLFIAYHFYPSTEIGARRLTALARYLAANGVRVVVVSAFHDKLIPPGSEILPGIYAVPVARSRRRVLDALVRLKRGIKRLSQRVESSRPTGAEVDAGAASKSGSNLRDFYFRTLYFVDGTKGWAWRASQAAIRASKIYGTRVLLASGPPHSTLLAGARAARSAQVPFVADFRDPWSDFVAYTYPRRTLELHMLRLLEGWVIRSAAAVTSTGGDVAALLKNRYRISPQKVYVVRNGYDVRGDIGGVATNGRLLMLFAGELYAGRNPFPLLAALESLLARPDVDSSRIEITFMGKADSYENQSLHGWIQGRRCESLVKILPPQSSDVVSRAVQNSTLLLNLAQQQHLSVPAKTFEQLASGREVLLLCEDESETSRLVSGITGVIQVDPSDEDNLNAVMLDLYTRHVIYGAMTVPSEHEIGRFSRQAANRQFLRILEALGGFAATEPVT